MKRISKYVGFGTCNVKYAIIIISAILLLFAGKHGYPLYIGRDPQTSQTNPDNHKLLKTFLKYLGFCLCFIGEIIRKKLSFKNKREEEIVTTLTFTSTTKTKPEAENYLITFKDILFIILIALSHLGNEFLAITLKAQSHSYLITIDEAYNTIEFIFFFLTSMFIFKLKYYKHQYISICFIIFFELLRIIIKTIFSHEELFTQFIKRVGIQIVRAFLDSIFLGYSKSLMENKYLSPYKALYIFGLLNLSIVIILYVVFSNISKKEKDEYFSLEYNTSYYYFDHFLAIFTDFSFVKFIGLFMNMVGVSGSCLIFNFIISDFTMCHIALYYQAFVLYDNIKQDLGAENKQGKFLAFIIVTSFLELIATLIFLEIIELRCCGLNKYLKKSIEERAIKEINDSYDTNDLDDENDEYDINIEEKRTVSTDSSKMVPLSNVNSAED